ncbi:MAG: hypothetical protein FJY99_10870 [Candidatus Sericytochromatia bacterium]|nr:hypothetical protein [Candidatus Tanganyikabacteria bacterium]
MPLSVGQRDEFRVEGGPLGLTEGQLSLEVLNLQQGTNAHLIQVSLERTGLLGSERKIWSVRQDAAGTHVDGRPFLPWQAAPGQQWPSQSGTATLEEREDLVLPSGPAKQCWRVRFDEPGSKATRWWFAPGCGLVQAEFDAFGSTVVARHERRRAMR